VNAYGLKIMIEKNSLSNIVINFLRRYFYENMELEVKILYFVQSQRGMEFCQV